MPVSIAIVTAFVASTYATLINRGDIYFDSLANLDVLTHARTIVFDKTGTLTEGRPVVLLTRELSDRAAGAIMIVIGVLAMAPLRMLVH